MPLTHDERGSTAKTSAIAMSEEWSSAEISSVASTVPLYVQCEPVILQERDKLREIKLKLAGEIRRQSVPEIVGVQRGSLVA